MKPRVWVVHNRGHDLTEAKRYGEVVSLLEGNVNVFDITSRLSEIREKLKEAKQDDFILLSGYALLNVLAAGVLLEKFGSLKILVFDGIRRDYKLRTLNRNQLTTGEVEHGGYGE